MAETVSMLRKHGLISSEEDPSDGRQTLLSATADGRALIESIPAAREAWMDGTQLDLTSVEFSLLETLLQHAGHVVTREHLTEVVLGRKLGPFDRVIDVHISNVRRKMTQAADAGERIKAVRGSGYLLVVRSEAT